MSDITARANVVLSVNGDQAKQIIDDINKKLADEKKHLQDLENAKASPKDIEKARKKVKELEKQLREAVSSTQTVQSVLEDLNGVSLRQLEQALRSLNKQFRDAKPGTEAYKQLAEQIVIVKDRIREVRDEIGESESMWDKFLEFTQDIFPSVLMVSEGFDAAVSSLREFVEAYADMDQEMASVKKYTGMSDAEIAELNDAFRKMDTRSSREDLNKLAQDAGRLGKQSVEDVLGFVRAADKINVALDDLGSEATLTLSKLTGVFGDEERLGTEKSLLSVGSVINELSQNCSASAPYIAEFASRMGGVGAQANMSAQQIMAFAAVLDSNNQKCEASSTALAQIITRLYQDPAKYAKVAGMDVQRFSELVRTDMNAALLEFLGTLQNAGGMDVLSPMFKDMGENGSRAIAALSTLAGNIDAVKAQQEVANKAFEEAISIDNEFNVQNNTVAASLEKCKNAANELRVQLGEKLYPLMSHMMTTSAAAVRGINVAVSFMLEYKSTLLYLALAVGAYTAAVKVAANGQMLWNKVTAAGKAVKETFKASLKLLSAAVYLFTGRVTKAKAAWQAFNAAFKVSVIGLAVTAITLLIVKLGELILRTDDFKDSMDDAMKSASGFTEEASKEIREIDKLFGALEGATKGTEKYNEAKNKIIARYSNYLKGLINEKGEIINLAEAYDRLTWAANKSAQARGINAAKESLTSTFYQDIDKDIQKLRARLKELGVDDRNLTRIMSQVASGISSEAGIPKAIQLEIAELEGSGGSITDLFKKDKNAYGIMNRMIAHKADYDQRMQNLSDMDNRYLASVNDDDLSKQIDSLSKALASAPVPLDKVEIETVVSLQNKDVLDKVKGAIGVDDSVPPVPLEFGKSGSVFGSTNNALANYTPKKGSGMPTASGSGAVSDKLVLNREQAENLLRELMFEKSQRGADQSAPETPSLPSAPYVAADGKDDKAKSIKESKKFKEAMEKIRGERSAAETQAMADRSAGLTDYREYLDKMRKAEVEYYDKASKLYVDSGIEEDTDHLALLKKKQEADDKYNQSRITMSREATERIAEIEEREINFRYNAKMNPSMADEMQRDDELLKVRYNKLMAIQKLYGKGSKEWEDIDADIDNLRWKDQEQKQKAFMQKVREYQAEFDKASVADRLKMELDALKTLFDNKKITQYQFEEWSEKIRKSAADELPGARPDTARSRADKALKSADKEKEELEKAHADGLISDDEYETRMARVNSAVRDNLLEPLKNAKSEWVALMATMADSWMDFADALKDPDADPIAALGAGIEATSAIMSAVMSQMTQLVQAEMQAQSAAVEKRYDREMKSAEGNSYLTSKLERQKEAELAEIKNEANRKMFRMQVIQAVAQTATNALNAYGSAAAIPVVGHVIAPIAAAAAVAAGLVQVAALKKQQQASEAQGYSKGGFTKPGAVDEPAGVVHAGEWVASQKLLASPVARSMINVLDYAQKTNTVGSLRSSDVSRSVTAGESLVRISESDDGRLILAGVSAKMTEAVDALTARLQEPFVTVNSVTGPFGSKKANDDYDKLIRNKSPKTSVYGNNSKR